MSSKLNPDAKNIRLADQVEIIREGTNYSPPSPNNSMEGCISELVECLELLDGTESASKFTDSTDPQKPALEAVTEMEGHIRRFQRQSAILRRLITKVH